MSIEMKIIDIEIYRGDDTNITFIITDNKDAPVDFTGAELSMLIRPRKGDTYLLKQGNGIAIVDNKVTLVFSHELTKDWSFKSADYDLQMIDSRGRYTTIVRGVVNVTRDITP